MEQFLVRRDRAHWKQLVEEFQLSGQDQATFCKERNIRQNRLSYWIRRLRPQASAVSSQSFVELPSLVSPAGSMELRLDLGSGIVLTLVRH